MVGDELAILSSSPARRGNPAVSQRTGGHCQGNRTGTEILEAPEVTADNPKDLTPGQTW
jgi:hypothetical protein